MNLLKNYRNPLDPEWRLKKITGLPTLNIGNFVQDLFETLMYYSEDGQVDNNPVRKQLIELFTYDIGVYDLDPNPDLKFFVQARAMIKTAKWLKYTPKQIMELLNRTLLVKQGVFFPKKLYCDPKDIPPDEKPDMPDQLVTLSNFIDPQSAPK